MEDEKGFLAIYDAILAISILFIAIFIFNLFLAVPVDTYSVASHNSKTSQDIMSLFANKINYTDESFIEEISEILAKNNNSKKSKAIVGEMVKDKLGSNYKFVFRENNVICDEIASNCDLYQKENYTVATRNYGNYSYTLYIFN